MMQLNDHEGDKDLSKHRIAQLDNGNEIHMERRDPYGFIHCWLGSGGNWPDESELNGVFTSWERAYLAVERYLTDRNAAVSDVRHVEATGILETNEEVRKTEDVGVGTVTRGVEKLRIEGPVRKAI